MNNTIIKYWKNIFSDIGLYISFLGPILIYWYFELFERSIVLNKEHVSTTATVIIALSIAFCYNVSTFMNDIDTNDIFYKKLLGNEILDEIHFLLSYAIFVAVINIVVIILFIILFMFSLIDNDFAIKLVIFPSIFSLYTLSEFINYIRIRIRLKKYKFEFEKIHINRQ